MFWLLPTLADVKSIAFHRSERRRLAGRTAPPATAAAIIKRHRVLASSGRFARLGFAGLREARVTYEQC